MKINENCKLIDSDIYLYDIKSCHYNILDRLGYNMDSIDKYNKQNRNIQIGYLMKNNPYLISLLRSYTNSLVDEFILRNNIKDNEIISRQYDGILINRPSSICNQYIDFCLRDIYQYIIISNNRDSYIAINNDDKIFIKGISDRYEKIDIFYYKLLRINYSNKKHIFSSLQKIKNEFYNSEDPEIFCIPLDECKYKIFLKNYGKMKISETIINMIDVDEIDKDLYFISYLKPFFDSIVITYI